MAVTIGTELVNNGNSGWTNADVMTALEKVFYDMGYNSGSQEDGVPIAVLYPGYNTSVASSFTGCIAQHYESTPRASGNSNFAHCGGPAPTALLNNNRKTRRFYVTNSGTSSWQIAEELRPQSGTGSNSVIGISGYMGENLTTGTKLTYNGQGTDILNGLSAGNVYYMRRVDDNDITLHNSASDAINNTGIIPVTYTSMSDPKHFRTDAQTNPTITLGKGDQTYWYTSDHTAGGEFRIFDATPGLTYAANRNLHENDNLESTLYRITGSGTFADPYDWNTERYWQTETEVIDPTEISGAANEGQHAYGYASDTHATMKGNIILNAQLDGTSYNNRTYWKYTVPASGSRSELKLRIFRDDAGTDVGTVSGILICSKATGWSDNEVFTIPGTAIGGTSPANDIEFGVNTDETSNGAADGKCSILTTSLGAGANMFQKHPDGHYGVLRLENSASKKFGKTYWGFVLDSNNYRIKLYSGSGWSYLNRLGKHFPYDSSYEGFFGAYNGVRGLDYADAVFDRDGTQYEYYHQYATSAGPTNYALKIRYHKAQAPQDTNFSTISFIQTINGVDRTYFSFSLHKGADFGANVWDYDECFLGTYTEYLTYWQQQGFGSNHSNWVEMRYITPGSSYSNSGPNAEPVTTNSMAREGSYGYLRNTTGRYIADTRYKSNIDTFNSTSEREVYMYYRNNTYDVVDFSSSTGYDSFTIKADMRVPVGVQYYKPMKGLPVCGHLIPCPYYLPDDFVMIHAEISPGATEFLPGDTVTISAGEVYTVITADNTTNQTGLDGVANNTVNGMLFCARI